MAGIWQGIEDTKDRLAEIATMAYQGLMFAKDSAYLTFSNDKAKTKDPQIYWSPQLIYERARGQLDTVQDIGFTFLGETETKKIMATAAKAVGYVPSTENGFSIHASAMLAKHAPSKTEYSTQSYTSGTVNHAHGALAQRNTSIYTGSGVHTISAEQAQKDFSQAGNPSGQTKRELQDEYDDYLEEEFGQMYEAFAYYIMFGQGQTSIELVNDDRQWAQLAPLTEQELMSWYTKNQTQVDAIIEQDDELHSYIDSKHETYEQYSQINLKHPF
jgi:hypothetical protein